MLLIDDRTRELTLDWTSAADLSLVPFLARAQNSSPNITSLRISTSSRNGSKEDERVLFGAVRQLVQSLVSLHTIHLPSRIQFDYSIWTATLELSKLRTIRATHEQSAQITQALEFSPQKGAPPDSVIHSLTEIDCDVPYSSMHLIIRGFRRTPRSELQTASFCIYDIPADGGVGGCISDFLAGAPHLSRLILVMAAFNTTLHLNNLVPLSRLSTLSVLKIQTNKPASLTDTDFRQLASVLPHLTELCITPDPPSGSRVRKASLSALNHFARHCRKIHTIALFLDTSGSYPYTQDASLPCFSETLRVLNFGSSPVQKDDVIPVALVLIHLTRGLQVEVAVCSRPVAEFEERGARSDPNSRRKDVQAWERVAQGMRRLRPYIDAKESYARRVAELEARVEALEGQVAQHDRDVKSVDDVKLGV